MHEILIKRCFESDQESWISQLDFKFENLRYMTYAWNFDYKMLSVTCRQLN